MQNLSTIIAMAGSLKRSKRVCIVLKKLFADVITQRIILCYDLQLALVNDNNESI